MFTVVDQAIIEKKCTELWLKYNHITSRGVRILADALQHSLTLNELYLYGNQISDSGSHVLSKVLSSKDSKLKRLSVGSNDITDEGVHYFAQMLKTNRTLTHILLSNNKITDRGCLDLANVLIHDNKTLERLDLDSNRGITDLSVRTLVTMVHTNDNIIGLNVSNCSLRTSSKVQLKNAVKEKEYFSLWT